MVAANNTTIGIVSAAAATTAVAVVGEAVEGEACKFIHRGSLLLLLLLLSFVVVIQIDRELEVLEMEMLTRTTGKAALIIPTYYHINKTKQNTVAST